MHIALFGIHQKLKGKTMKAKNSEVTRSINGVVFSTEAAKAAVEHKRHTEAAGESLIKFNNAGIAMFEAGEKVGKSRRTCKNAQAFYDGLVAGGIKGNTAANYLTSFRQVVSTGKAIAAFNTNTNKAKAGTQVTSQDATKAINSALRKLWNTEGIEHVIEQVEAAFNDAKADTMLGALQYVMESRGIPFDDEGKATTEAKAKAK